MLCIIIFTRKSVKDGKLMLVSDFTMLIHDFFVFYKMILH